MKIALYFCLSSNCRVVTYGDIPNRQFNHCPSCGVVGPDIETLVAADKSNHKQIGGVHYKLMTVQPWDFIEANNIPFLEGSAIKYLSRWRDKGGVEDLKKAIHFIEKRIELETPNKTE